VWKLLALYDAVVLGESSVVMSTFTFGFDLENDLDESFDAIPPHEPAAVPSMSGTCRGNHAFCTGPC
jgi:hypothetical protein